jgi:large subunit ribosomal protein L28e
MASTDLIWHLVKNNNAFLVRRDRCSFSTEAGNLRNLHARRFSGLVQKRAIDIQASADGKGVVLSVKSSKPSASRKPATQWNKVTLKKDFRRTARAIKGAARSYRSDLTGAALARYTKLYYAAKTKAAAKRSISQGPRKSPKTLAKARRGGKAAKYAARKSAKKTAVPAQ